MASAAAVAVVVVAPVVAGGGEARSSSSNGVKGGGARGLRQRGGALPGSEFYVSKPAERDVWAVGGAAGV